MSANAFNAAFDDEAHALFVAEGMADIANYTAPGGSAVDRRVFVNPGTQSLGEYGQVLSPRTVVGFLLADGPVVKDAGVVIAGRTYVLQAIDLSDSNDGSLQLWVVRNG